MAVLCFFDLCPCRNARQVVRKATKCDMCHLINNWKACMGNSGIRGGSQIRTCGSRCRLPQVCP